MTDGAEDTRPETTLSGSRHDERGASVSARGGSSGAAAAVTGDDPAAGAWPDDIPADRGSAAQGAAVAPPTSPEPELAATDEGAGSPARPASEEHEAAKLGDFA